jgi:hypothetical protein
MNVALPALVVFLILLPGFLFHSKFKRIEQTSLDYAPFGQTVIEATTWATVLHIVWLIFSTLVFDRYCDVDTLLRLLSADPKNQNIAISSIDLQAGWIALYFGSLVFGAYGLAAALRYAITAYRWDRHGSLTALLFRFKAPWYYLLTGADFEEGEQPDLIYVTAIVNVAGDAVLYRGVLDEFFVGPDGVLDRLVLQDVTRRPISKDKGSEMIATLNESGEEKQTTLADDSEEENTNSQFYGIDGDYFVLRYSEAITLNVQYIKYDVQPADEQLSAVQENDSINNDVASG